MFPFVFLDAIHHAIIVAVVAFFVLFAASKADGFVKILGNVLGWLLLIIAFLALVCGLSAPFFGGHPFGMEGWGMHPGMMGPHWDHWHHLQPPAPPAK